MKWCKNIVKNCLERILCLITLILFFGCSYLTSPEEPDQIAVTGASISPFTATISVGERVQIVPSISPENATDSSITWASTDPNIASVDSDGLVLGRGVGNTTISSTTNDGNFTDETYVSVISPTINITSIELTPMTSNISIGGSVQLSPLIYPVDATDQSLIWSSTDTSIVSVDQNGLVSAISNGIVTISATSMDGKTAGTSIIAVEEPTINVTSLSLSPQESGMIVGERIQLVPTINPPMASVTTVSWTSSAPSIASIDQTGLLTAHSEGAVVISATSTDGGFTDSINIDVIVPVTSVSLDTQTFSLDIGETRQLNCSVEPSDTTNPSLRWSSSDISVATISDSGLITAISKGSSVIRVETNDGGFFDTLIVAVEEMVVNVISISISPSYSSVEEGSTLQLYATLEPSDATETSIIWNSSNASIVSVDANGLVTALKSGTTTISARSNDGDFIDTTEIVVPPTPSSPKSITVNYDFLEEYAGNAPNIYVIWLENSTTGELQHLYVCEKLLNGGVDSAVADTVLPFWHVSRYNDSDPDLIDDVDGVTSATLANQDISITKEIEERMGDEFTLYFELDQSFQWNDWFAGPYLFDQQAVLYKTEVNLSDAVIEYTLEPVGWTPNQDYTVAGVLRPVGELISEMRFITHSRIDDTPTFGDGDSANSAIQSVGSIRAIISQ